MKRCAERWALQLYQTSLIPSTLQPISNTSWNHTSVAFNVSFLRKGKQIKTFSISPYIEHAMLPKFKAFWKCNFHLKLSREVAVA